MILDKIGLATIHGGTTLPISQDDLRGGSQVDQTSLDCSRVNKLSARVKPKHIEIVLAALQALILNTFRLQKTILYKKRVERRVFFYPLPIGAKAQLKHFQLLRFIEQKNLKDTSRFFLFWLDPGRVQNYIRVVRP